MRGGLARAQAAAATVVAVAGACAARRPCLGAPQWLARFLTLDASQAAPLLHAANQRATLVCQPSAWYQHTKAVAASPGVAPC